MVGSSWKELLVHFVGSTILLKNISASSPQFNGVAKRALWLIEAAALAATIQASILFSSVELPSSESLWTEAMSWACNTLFCNDFQPRQQITARYVAWQPTSASFAAMLQAWLLQSQANEQVAAQRARMFLSRPRIKPPPGFCASIDREQLGYHNSQRNLAAYSPRIPR